MKKSIRKIIAAFIAVLTITSAATISFAAEEITTPIDTGVSTTAVVDSGEEIAPCADDIKWVYTTGSDGSLWKRRYNYTTGEWVDPYWIYIG